MDKTSVSIAPDSSADLTVTIYGSKPLGTYNGTLFIRGDIEKDIPIKVKVVEKRFPVETLLMEIDLFNRVVSAADYLVKTGAVETQQRFGKTAIYHHKIIESEVYAKETELETKLKLDLIFEICDSVSDCSEKDGCLCVNRIVLLGDEVKNLQVCGK